MTLPQLNAAVHRELSYISTDEEMMSRTLRAMRRIRRERKSEQKALLREAEPVDEHDSDEQIIANLREAFHELKLIQEGKLEGRPIEELFAEL